MNYLEANYRVLPRIVIKAAECEVLKYLNNLPEIDANAETPDRLQTIEKIYYELSNPTHPVSIAMQKMRDIPEIRIIEGNNR